MSYRREWVEELLLDWAGYERTWSEQQGNLQHMSADLMEQRDRALTRAPFSYSDPLFANYSAEQRARLSFIASMAMRIWDYPSIWLQLLVPRYIGEPDTHSETGRPCWTTLTWGQIEKRIGLSERDRQGAMRTVHKQLKIDVKLTLSGLGRGRRREWEDIHYLQDLHRRNSS